MPSVKVTEPCQPTVVGPDITFLLDDCSAVQLEVLFRCNPISDHRNTGIQPALLADVVVPNITWSGVSISTIHDLGTILYFAS